MPWALPPAAFSPDLLAFGVACSGAIQEGKVRSTRTAFELSRALKLKGWRPGAQKKHASIAGEKFLMDAPAAYFSLLVYFGDALQAYEDAGCFSHTQSNAYYEALEAAVIYHDQDAWRVSPCCA